MPSSASFSIWDIAKRPIKTGNNVKPYINSSSKPGGTSLSLLLSPNWPIKLIKTPRNPLKIPTNRLPFDNEAITVRAKRIIKNFSTDENLMAIEAKTGVKKYKISRENIPPNNDETTPIFKAFSGSPFLAMGYASKVVQMDDGVPGMFIKVAGTRPPLMPPTYSPSNRAKDSVKGYAYVTGKNTAIAIVAVIPGIAPKIIPIITPIKHRIIAVGVRPNIILKSSPRIYL